MKIEGYTPPNVPRIITGLQSFDRAFENKRGDIGFPAGQATEIAGPTGCGKSTTVYGLAGIIAKWREQGIVLADLEGFDPEFLTDIMGYTGFDGSVYVVQDETDEALLDKMVKKLKEDKFGVAILDSIAAISPVSEKEGDLGAANMGRRAMLVGQLSRKTTHYFLNHKDKNLFVINHIHPNIMGFGYVTPGGESLKYLCAVRIRVKRKKDFPELSYVLEGKVVKNKFGYGDRQFYLVLLSGKGIHKGLTALWDCSELKLITSDRNIIKIDGKSHGHIKTLFKNAHEGKDEVFDPFIEILERHYGEVGSSEQADDSDDNDEMGEE